MVSGLKKVSLNMNIILNNAIEKERPKFIELNQNQLYNKGEMSD